MPATPKHRGGRKPLPDAQKKKRRVLYLTDEQYSRLQRAIDRLTEETTTMTTATTEITATERVNNSDALRPFADLLLNYDWSNRDEHLTWIATAPEAEIVEWAQIIARDERNG